MGFSSLDELPPIAPYLPEASLLEAELAGQAEAILQVDDEAGTPTHDDAARPQGKEDA